MSPIVRKPRLIPVLDVMQGRVMRAKEGKRKDYRPIVSAMAKSSEPQAVLTAILNVAQSFEAYIADLDAILSDSELSPTVFNLLSKSECCCWVDVGLRSWHTYQSIPFHPSIWPVVALESATLQLTAEVAASRSEDPFAFSIDMHNGQLMGDWRAWGLSHECDALGLARMVVALGYRTLIVLDLAHVGMGAGCGTEPLLRAIRTEMPGVELIAGGGVRTWADVDRLGDAGADAVLVASALHDGTLTFPRPDSATIRP